MKFNINQIDQEDSQEDGKNHPNISCWKPFNYPQVSESMLLETNKQQNY